MLIGIDGHRLHLRDRQGLGVYSYNLIKGLSEIDGKNQYFVLTSHKEELSLAPNFSTVSLPAPSEVLWEQIRLPLELKKRSLDLVHFTVNSAPLSYSGKMVLTIHDLAFFRTRFNVPGLYYGLTRRYRQLVVPRMAKRAQAVIAVSEHTKKELVEKLGLKEEKVRVIHEAADSAFYPVENREYLENFRRRHSLPRKYVLAFGSGDPRKNTQGIIDAYIYLFRAKRLEHALVMVGIDTKVRERIEAYLKSKEVFGRAFLLGYLTSADLNLLYNGAEVFLFPSFCEGFGLPLLEAMACGTPVITSRFTSTCEIADGAALLIDPYSAQEIADALYLLLSGSTLRERLSRAGTERAKEFSWENTARRTLELYQEVCDS